MAAALFPCDAMAFDIARRSPANGANGVGEMGFDRRSVLGGMAGAGLLAGPWSPAAAAGLRVRRSISSLPPGDPDLDALRRAIPVLQGWGAWRDQIAIHANTRHRHHASWRFLPWHRLQLVWFERLVARASGKADFALPYWDWDDDVVPELFWQDVLNAPGRRARPGDTITDFLRPYGQVLNGRLTDDFATFFGRARTGSGGSASYYSGSAEWGGHNLIHTFVGGDMGDLTTSPNDPLFWLHHANIDRIWTMWRIRHGGQIFPPAWQNESLGGFVDDRGNPVAPVKAITTIDAATFGYTYPYDPTPPVFFAAMPGAPIIKRKAYSWSMQRMGPVSAFIEISADLARAEAETATGFLQIVPDPHAATTTTLTARARSGGRELYRDTVFTVPMGHAMGAQGFRIPLKGLWGASDTGGIRLEIEVASVPGGKPAAMAMPGEAVPGLVDFILDAELAFRAS